AWNQPEKEILIAVDDEMVVRQLTQKFAGTDMTVVTFAKDTPFETIEEWMKTDAAIAVVSTEKSKAIHKRAQAFDIIVMSSVETAVESAYKTNDTTNEKEIKKRKENNQKEVILQ